MSDAHHDSGETTIITGDERYMLNDRPENIEPKEDEYDKRIKEFKKICHEMHETYAAKNRDYGNSFGEMCNEFGLVAAVIRLIDKLNRLKTFAKTKELKVKDETIKDTLMDLATYAIMTIIAIEEEKG